MLIRDRVRTHLTPVVWLICWCMIIVVLYTAVLTEIFEAIRYPVALSGTRTGVHRVLHDYGNAVLRRRRRQLVSSPKYVDYLFVLSTMKTC